MNITEMYDLQKIINELEVAYQIAGSDFEEKDIDTVIKNVKSRINRQYNVDLSEYKVDASEIEIGTYRNEVAVFIDNVTRLHSKLSGYCQINRYTKTSQVSVRDINYLGFTEESLKTALIALQRKASIPGAVDAIKAIKDKLGTINTCREKRLFMLLVISEAIGFNEVTAAIAEILYISTVR